MKAAIYTKYGPPDAVALADVAVPTPKDNAVLIRIHASTISTGMSAPTRHCPERRHFLTDGFAERDTVAAHFADFRHGG